MAVPNTFATATSAIPLANLDANFAYYDGAFSISGTTTSFSGNVGIGTSSPVSKLQVTNSLAITATSGYQFLLIGNQDSLGTNKPTIIRSANASLQFGIGDSWSSSTGGTFTPYLNIGSTGNVGIGTTSPSYKLDVSGTFRATGLSNFDNAISLNTATLNYLYYTSALSFSQTGTGERMRINSSGQVGIGTSAPTGQLDVRSAAGVVAQSNLYTGSNAAVVKFNIGQVGAIDWDIGLNATAGNFYIGGLGGSMAEAYKIVRSGLSIDYQTWNTNSAERMRIDSSGNVGVGTSAPSQRLQVGDGTADTRASFRPNNAFAIGIANGSGFAGWIGGSGTADNMVFSNSAGTERMRIDSSGNVLVTGTGTGSLGYGTGSGGTVTQATSRTTGVTLNKPTGAITLVSAAGSPTWQEFTVTNSIVTANDTFVLNQRAGADRYVLQVRSISAGSFVIAFQTTGGTTTEQPIFNFSIIKGSTS